MGINNILILSIDPRQSPLIHMNQKVIKMFKNERISGDFWGFMGISGDLWKGRGW